MTEQNRCFCSNTHMLAAQKPFFCANKKAPVYELAIYRCCVLIFQCTEFLFVYLFGIVVLFAAVCTTENGNILYGIFLWQAVTVFVKGNLYLAAQKTYLGNNAVAVIGLYKGTDARCDAVEVFVCRLFVA